MNNNLSKKLDQIISNELSKTIIPVKTADGILVGDVLIISRDTVKDLYKKEQLIYKNVHLNSSAIKLANMLCRNGETLKSLEIYRLDQEYGKWFVDSQLLRANYQKALNNRDHDRADMLWARYIESRDRTIAMKNRVESLTRN